MTRSRLLLSATLLFSIALAGCDALGGSSDDVTGTWMGEVTFKTDTLLTGPAVRIEYDMVERLELRLVHQDGLVRGTVTRTGEGTKVFRSATGVVDSTRISDREPVSHDVYGTFVEDTDQLKLDVLPRWRDNEACGGTEVVPYSAGLLTFDVSGRKGRSQAYILLRDGGIGSAGEEFQVDIRSDERLTIDRDASDAPGLAEVATSCFDKTADGSALAEATQATPPVRVVD